MASGLAEPGMTAKHIALWSIGLTIAIEIVTCISRFGFKMQSTRDTASTIGVLTGGIRIHHGYIGVLMVLVSLLFLKSKPAVKQWVMIIGISFICSDLIHHFLVLWPVTGSPEFDLVY